MTEFEQQLESLIRQMKSDSDRVAAIWGQMGNAMLAYTNNNQGILNRLSKIVSDAQVPAQPARPLQAETVKTELPPTQPRFPSSSQQAPWPPDGASGYAPPPGYAWPPSEPPRYVQPPQQYSRPVTPPPAAPNGNGGYSLRETLSKIR